MKISTRAVLLLFFTAAFTTSFSQNVISYESFPQPFNTNHDRPINSGFNEATGKWIGYSTDEFSIVSVDDNKSVSSPFSLVLANLSTSKCSKESVCRATSPTVNCTAQCVKSLSLQFKLNALKVNASNSYFYFHVDISKDNGTNWTTVLAKTASQLVSSYGTDKWNDVTISIPADFYTPSFRYRFLGCQQPGCNYDNWLNIDDVKLIGTPCTSPPVAKLRLGNQVWNDRDGDGKRDDNEPAIGGVTISLYTDNNSDNLPDGPAIRTTMSDAQGHYLFTDLPAGRYIASMPIIPGYQQDPNTTTQAISPYPDLNVDNVDKLVRLVGPNAPGGVVYTNAITLSAGQEPTTDGDDADGNLTFDLAECGNSGIGDFVWNDLNGNGIQDAGEPGINGVLVTITFEDGRTATVLTHNYNATNNANAPQYDGYYDFINLGPGTYKITFATPAGLHASPPNVGNDAKDSDPVNGGPVTVTLAANQSNFTIDAGFTNYTPPPVAKLRLGNQVWNDRDGDGKRDDNEPAIGGVTISLYTDNNSDNLPDGPAIRTTMSDAQGHYLFTDLPAGRYIASMPIIPGYQQDPNTTTQAISPYPDLNVDNVDKLVRLVGPNAPGGIVYTNAITLSAGQEPTTDGDDADGNLTFDLAECGNSGIGDFVWNDLNGNGIQDAGEPGINGVLVTITFEDGRTATVLTHNYNATNNANAPQYDGYYDFINLGPGTYKITFATPAGLHASPPNVGNDAKDSDPVNGGPVTVTLAANQSNFTIDAGFTNYTPPPPPPTCPNLSLGNLVFNDVNDNGVKDANEQGIGGLTVKLYADNDGNNLADGAAISTLTTAADGTYYFGNLSAGKYIVGVTLTDSLIQGANADATPNDNKDNDNNGVKTVNGQVFSNFITLSAGDEPINDGSDNNSNLTLDFGLQLKAAPCTNHCQCHNDCNHTDCGHPNCSHNSCHNDCNHTNCGHPNCGHPITNGDCEGTTNKDGYFGGFEAGSTNFTSTTGKTDLRYGLPRNGSFEIVKKASDAGGGGYLNITPHSGSNFMLIHTSSDASDRLWSTTVKVVPGKTYNVCIWVANAKTDPVNGFAITLNAGDKIIAKGNADYDWGKLCATYTVPSGVNSIEFSIKDPYPEIGASHFLALDDVCISADQNSLTANANSESKSAVKPIYPNPAGTNFTVTVSAAKQGSALVKLVNMNGKTIFTEKRNVTPGENALAIDRISDVTGGTYNVQVLVDDKVYNQLLIISR